MGGKHFVISFPLGQGKILSQTFMRSIKTHPEGWVLIEDSSLFLLWISHFETDDLKLFEIYWLDAISAKFISLWSWTNMSCRTKTKGMVFLATAVDQEFSYCLAVGNKNETLQKFFWLAGWLKRKVGYSSDTAADLQGKKRKVSV